MRLTITEAAAHCGYKSRTMLYRLQRTGMLRDYEVARRGRSLVLESNPPGRCSLREHVAACLQLRHDSPLVQRPQRADWPTIAERLNGYLGPGWPAPPWDGEQANTVAMCLALAEQA